MRQEQTRPDQEHLQEFWNISKFESYANLYHNFDERNFFSFFYNLNKLDNVASLVADPPPLPH